ncbi:MAG: tetrahydrofolate dehydrogenase/cyclohydrolase catalytic domain-containing protein, partial [Candidatus Methylomirabilia bacterium]
MAKILDGKLVAQKVLDQVRRGVDDLCDKTGLAPMLAVVLVGDFAPSRIYVNTKKKMAAEVGIASQDHLYPQGLSETALLDLLKRLSDDPGVHGILLQLPL